MTRVLRAAALLGLAVPSALAAQRPAVSPALPRAWQRDTTFSVWLFVRPAGSLDGLAARITSLGGRVRVASRWLHAVSADVPTAALRTLAQDPLLRRIQPLGRFRARPVPSLESRVAPAADTCPAAGDPVYGSSEMPYRQLNLRPLTDRGIDATGVRILILDTGFDTQNPAFSGVSVRAQRDFVFGDSVVRNEANDRSDAQDHGTAVWSLFAGDVPGRLRGIARGASYVLAKTEDIRSETRLEEDNYVAALEWADSIGVDVASSSLAYLTFDNGFGYSPSDLNGDIAVTTLAADAAAQRGIAVVTAADNTGPDFRTISTPGDGDSVITVGAEDSLGAIAPFSSRGPTADGRLKPDLTAPGVVVCVVTGSGLVRRLSGTSFATPIVAAAAALVKRLHPDLDPIALRDALRRYATNRTTPDSTRGWGRPNVTASAIFPRDVIPLSPLPGAIASVSPVFSWTAGAVPAFATPITYRLKAARDSSLGVPVLDTTLAGESVAPRQAYKAGPLFWRVYATASTGHTATTGTVGPGAVPSWAILTALSDPRGTSTNELEPTFTWTSPAVSTPPGPFTYDLIVRRAVDQVPVFSAGGLTGTTYRLPQPLERNTLYTWSLVVHAGADTSLVSSLGSFLVLDASVPAATLLYQNFPNPFPSGGRDSTCLWFDLATTGRVELAILDLRGSPVRRFVPGPDFPPLLSAGRYGRGVAGGSTCDPRLMWDGSAENGRFVPAGVYLYRFTAPGIILFKRIVFRGRTP